jgi:ribonuclease D
VSEAEVELIESPTALADLFGELAAEPLLAIDTEAASFHRYRDMVYLLQISSRGRTAVVDPLAVPDLAALGGVLANPAVEIVFHDADYDLRLLEQQYGFRATRLFDTRVAAQLLHEPAIGLAALLEKYFSVRLDKRFQRADWSARPLSHEMIAYAASDTRHLPALRDVMREALAARGRLAWAEEEFALLAQVRWRTDDGEPGFLRIKGAKALRSRSLAVLRELFRWREELAARADRAPFRILNNEPMLEIARSQPRDVVALRSIRGVGADLAERRGRELLAAVERGLELPESDLPRVARGQRRAPDAAYEARLERLKSRRNELATAYDLAPGVLCPNGTLEAIARAEPRTPEELRAIPEIRRWQVNEIGQALLAAVAGGQPAAARGESSVT